MRALLIASLLWVTPAHAVPAKCDSPEAIAAYLLKVHGEYLHAKAKGKRGVHLRFYVSKKNTWTMVVVDRNGLIACLWIAGTDWRKQEAWQR